MDGKYEIGPSMFSHIEEENKKSHAVYSIPWTRHYEIWIIG